MAQRLEALEQWVHCQVVRSLRCCIELVRHVGDRVRSGHMTRFMRQVSRRGWEHNGRCEMPCALHCCVDEILPGEESPGPMFCF